MIKAFEQFLQEAYADFFIFSLLNAMGCAPIKNPDAAL